MTAPISASRPRTAVAVDGQDPRGGLIRSATSADVELSSFRNLEELVTALEADVSKNGPLTELHLYDHGSPGQFEIGDQHLFGMDLTTNPDFAKPELLDLVRRLGKVVAPGGVIELHACRVARDDAGQELLQRLANLTGVTVRGGVNVQSSGDPTLQGPYVECKPSPAGAPAVCSNKSNGWFSDSFSNSYDAFQRLLGR